MTYKALVSAILLSSSLFIASEAQAKPDMTAEQLAKARQVAAQMKPSIDFDKLLDEADKLGVVCEGDLTRRYRISMCQSAINTAQSKKRQAKLDEENARLDEEYARLEAENKALKEDLRNKVNALADQAEQKLQGMGNFNQ